MQKRKTLGSEEASCSPEGEGEGKRAEFLRSDSVRDGVGWGGPEGPKGAQRPPVPPPHILARDAPQRYGYLGAVIAVAVEAVCVPLACSSPGAGPGER